jgi:hypothetical protein
MRASEGFRSGATGLRVFSRRALFLLFAQVAKGRVLREFKAVRKIFVEVRSMRWTEKEERAYRAMRQAIDDFVFEGRTSLVLVHERLGTLEFYKVGDEIVRKDVLSDGREVYEYDVPLTAVERAVFRALLYGWRILEGGEKRC